MERSSARAAVTISSSAAVFGSMASARTTSWPRVRRKATVDGEM
jgi:hypothetical protein